MSWLPPVEELPDEYRGPAWTPDSNEDGYDMDLPYPDAETRATSGHSGSATSKARAHALDASGQTRTLRERALLHLSRIGTLGLTAREFGDLLGIKHQTYSSVMSGLHHTGRIVRLLEQRKGGEVYVLPQYVNDRPISEFRPNAAARKIATLLALVEAAEADGATAIYLPALRKALS
jgi:hypothetical protein